MICAPAEPRPAFHLRLRERNSRECSEDGTDDHISEKWRAKSLSFWREEARTSEAPEGEKLKVFARWVISSVADVV